MKFIVTLQLSQLMKSFRSRMYMARKLASKVGSSNWEMSTFTTSWKWTLGPDGGAKGVSEGTVGVMVGLAEVVAGEGVGKVVVRGARVGALAGGVAVVVEEGVGGGGAVLGLLVIAGVGTGEVTVVVAGGVVTVGVGEGEGDNSTSTVPDRTGVSNKSLKVSENRLPVAVVSTSAREVGPTAPSGTPSIG